MALDTYSALRASVLGWLARPGDPLVSGAVPDMIRLFEAEAGRRLKTIDAERYTEIRVTGGSSTVSLPEDYRAARNIRWAPSNRTLQYLPPGGSDTVWGDSGTPRYYAILGQNEGGELTALHLLLSPAPDQDGMLAVTYQVGVPALSAQRPSNWLLRRHADAYLFGTLAEAELYIGHDERAPLWLQRREAAFVSIEAYDRKARWGGPMQIRVDGITSPSGSGVGGATVGETVEEIIPVRVVYPTSGGIVVMNPSDRAIYVVGGPFATLTIRLPESPPEDALVEISFEKSVTALTLTNAAGGAVTDAPASAYGPGAGLQLRFIPEAPGGWTYWK